VLDSIDFADLKQGFQSRVAVNYFNKIYLQMEQERTKQLIDRELKQEKIMNYITSRIHDLVKEKTALMGSFTIQDVDQMAKFESQ